ncbi:MAG: EAL domain-containing protein [Nitrospirae bacterium]|nr:EAL domain-containing protein [Nitrospirota bacterium]
MLSCSRTVTFKQGDFLMREGDRADSFFFVTDGEFEVLRRTAAGVDQRLNTISAPALVGEMILFLEQPVRVASVKALTDGVAFCIRTEEFRREMGSGSLWAFKVVYQMARSLADRLDGMNTQLVKQLTRVAESEERYALSARGATDGLWDWDLSSNAVHYSPRWKAMLGWEDFEIGTSPDEWFKRVYPEDVEGLRKAIARHLDGQAPHLEHEYRMQHRDGTVRWMLTRGVAVRRGVERCHRMAGSQTDITERKKAEQQLLHDALHSSLTGLPNRALFMDRLGLCARRASRRKDYIFAVLFLDLDRFKVLNESLGHSTGDQLLIEVARRLQECVRASDTVAHLGGDEFVLLLDETRGVDEAGEVAARIQKQLALPMNLNGQFVFTSASIGIALSTSGFERPEDLIRNADIAMYRAKALGRARHEVYTAGMHDEAVVRLHLETDLRRAIEASEFILHYQPIVSLETAEIVGFEALIRWEHPRRGLVPPYAFIPIAEETGLIVPMGSWVLREASRQMQSWHQRFPKDPPRTIAVNLAARQLVTQGLVAEVEAALAGAGLQAPMLKLELTESTLMEHSQVTVGVLEKLRSLGVGLTVDDFGTGYSSLSYLQDFPINTLKIDRSFVARMATWRDGPELVNTIVTLAHRLGLDVVAEGVETAEQLAYLKSLGCEYAQGYYFFKPMDGEAVGKVLAKEHARGASAAVGADRPAAIVV